MTDQLLDIFKYSLLALLYLFFARVLWAVWSEVRGPKPARQHAGAATAARATTGRATGRAATRAARAAAAGGTAATAGGTATGHLVGPADPTVPSDAPPPAPPPPKPVKGKRGNVGRLVITQPRARKGSAYAVTAELTVGRADTCSIGLPDDTFASQLHARVFRHDAGVWVEDLGSTNGTHLNGHRIASPVQLAKGDRLQIGNTVFEAE